MEETTNTPGKTDGNCVSATWLNLLAAIAAKGNADDEGQAYWQVVRPGIAQAALCCTLINRANGLNNRGNDRPWIRELCDIAVPLAVETLPYAHPRFQQIGEELKNAQGVSGFTGYPDHCTRPAYDTLMFALTILASANCANVEYGQTVNVGRLTITAPDQIRVTFRERKEVTEYGKALYGRIFL